MYKWFAGFAHGCAEISVYESHIRVKQHNAGRDSTEPFKRVMSQLSVVRDECDRKDDHVPFPENLLIGAWHE